MPSPNLGLETNGLALVQEAVKLLEKALPQLGAESEAGQAAMKAMQSLSKTAPQGATSPGINKSAMMQHMLSQRQENPMMAILRAQGMSQSPAGTPGSEPQQSAQVRI